MSFHLKAGKKKGGGDPGDEEPAESVFVSFVLTLLSGALTSVTHISPSSKSGETNEDGQAWKNKKGAFQENHVEVPNSSFELCDIVN